MDKLRQLQLLVRPDTCRCRKLGHPMRPGSIRAGARRSGLVG
jgi:hypothetical protein